MNIQNRNKYFLEYLQQIDPSIQLFGDFNRPKPVIEQDDKFYTLPCYVHNYQLVLLDSVIEGKVIHTLKLQFPVPPEDVEKLREWKEKGFQIKRCYFIRNTEDNLYLTEQKVTSKMYPNEIPQPVFSYSLRKLYLNYRDAVQDLFHMDTETRSNLIIV